MNQIFTVNLMQSSCFL